MREVLYARCSYGRRPERRLLATVEREDGGRFFYKTALEPAARAYLRELREREASVRGYVGSRAEVVTGEPAGDDRLRYPFFELPTVHYLAAESLERGGVAESFSILDRLVSWVRALPVVEAHPGSQAAFSAVYGDGLGLFPGRV